MTSIRPVRSRGMRLAQLRLSNWRNFLDVDVALEGRVLLFGPNAAGKSHLLDSMRFLHDLVALGGGFGEAVAKRGGVSRLRCLAARRHPDVHITAVVGHGDDGSAWTYEISFGQEPRGHRSPMVTGEVVKKSGKVILERPDEADRQDPDRLRQSHIEQMTANREFRKLADFFRTIRYVHLVPLLVRESERCIGHGDDPFGSDFLEQVARAPDRVRKARLQKIGAALQVAVPQLQALEFFRDPVRGTPHLRGKFEHWWPKGAWQTEEQFSDGTLRLLGLLWAVLEGSGPLLLEEPELNLHPDVARYIPQMFAQMQRRSGRQVMVSSHSVDLLRDEGIGLNEVLLLRPGPEGTRVEAATKLEQATTLLAGGVPLTEIVVSATRPPNSRQLALFGE